MQNKIEVWNGAPEENGICRMSAKSISKKFNVNKRIAKKIFENKSMMCIDASDEQFRNFGAMTWEDIAVIQKYIETLIFSCSKWK